jgi:hypothetical protein
MSTADPAAYGWLHGDLSWFGEAACVTVAAGVTREQFVNAFGVDLASPQSTAQSTSQSGADSGAPEDTDGPAQVSFTEVAGCLVAVEVNGLIGAEADVLEATSMAGRAASASWNATGMVRFACARDGAVLYDGELAPDGVPEGTEGLPPQLAGLVGPVADDQPSAQAVAMALVEAWTGARVSAADIERALTLGYVAEG